MNALNDLHYKLDLMTDNRSSRRQVYIGVSVGKATHVFKSRTNMEYTLVNKRR